MRTVRGEMRFALTCEPRFDYGRQRHEVQVTEEGATFTGAGLELTLHAGVPLERHGDDVRAEVTLRAGDVAGVVLESAADGPPRRPSPDELLRAFVDTGRVWRGWLATSTYRGRWRGGCQPVGDHPQAHDLPPERGLRGRSHRRAPEQVGGERNWDYRFTWVRDGSFSVHALLGLGFTEEAEGLHA